MWNLKACTVCLSTNVNLYSLNVGTLRKDLNLVSGLKMSQSNGMPEYLCVECTAYVEKFKKFRDKCHRAFYILSQILVQNKEINEASLTNINRKELEIMPTLSYMSMDRSNYSQFQFHLVDYYRGGVSQNTHIPIAHCTTLTPEDTFENEMKNVTQTDPAKCIKIEIEQPGKLLEDVNQTHNQNDMTTDNFTNDPTVNKSSISENLNDGIVETDQNGDDFHTPIEYDDTDNEDDGKFEQISCKLGNKEEIKYSDKSGDVVPITVKEAKAAVEVYNYTSQGHFRCHCGKAFHLEKYYKIHCRRHDLHVSGTHHCQICDCYFKTAFLLQCHMTDQHMYKYLCKICPEVNFNKITAKQHYSSHVKTERGSEPQNIGNQEASKKPSFLTPTKRGGARIKGVVKQKPKKVTKKDPKDFPIYTPQSQPEQYEMIQQRKLSRNYLEAKYKCEQCYRGYRLTTTYTKHMVKHDPKKSGSHQCDMCKHYFRDMRRLYKHMIMYHLFRYSCQLCDYVTTHKGQAMYHYKWHKNVKYDCPHCDKTFNKITTKMTHIRFKHPGTDVCNICGHSFVSSSGLRFHKLVSHSKREIDIAEEMVQNPDTSSPYHCAECCLQFVTEEAYVTHLGSSKKHVEINVSSQSVMKGKARSSRRELGAVAKDTGSGARPKTRRGRPPGDSQVLNTGISTSTDCSVCGQFLASDVEARRHYEAEHPGTDYLKRYMCDVCGHTTKQFANLLVHMRTHTREKPYPCPHCDRRFSMPSNRDRHLVVHTGEKRFQCQHCNRRFTQSTAVKLHIQTVHMKIPYKPWDKKNRKRRKEAQLNSICTEVVDVPETATAAVAPVPQHKLLIEPQGDYITYIYTHEQ